MEAEPGQEGVPPGDNVFNIEPGKPAGMPYWAWGEDKSPRAYDLFVPFSWKQPSAPIPLWVLAPGTDMSSEEFFQNSGLKELAEEKTIAMAALQGQELRFDVAEDARKRGWPHPDDDQYTKAVLRDVISKVNINMRRIYCVGFSRGARFCSRLASQLSSFFAAIATVSGIRYPKPNNATRPIPILAIHGTGDETNPFWGGGMPYWGTGVNDAIMSWASFNGCQRSEWVQMSPIVGLDKHYDCRDGGDVWLYKLEGGEHMWPDAKWMQTKHAIWDFFDFHELPEGCRTAEPGTRCYTHVAWARSEGVKNEPALYYGLTENSTFEDFQAILRHWVYSNCPEPCPPTTTEPPETTDAEEALDTNTTNLTDPTGNMTNMTNETASTTASATMKPLAERRVPATAGPLEWLKRRLHLLGILTNSSSHLKSSGDVALPLVSPSRSPLLVLGLVGLSGMLALGVPRVWRTMRSSCTTTLRSICRVQGRGYSTVLPTTANDPVIEMRLPSA